MFPPNVCFVLVHFYFEIVYVFDACSVSGFDLLSDVFRQQNACFMDFEMWRLSACKMMLMIVFFSV